MVVFFLGEVNDYVFYTMSGLSIKEVEGIVRSWEMAIHAVRHKALGIISMGRSLPGVIGKVDFVTSGTELRC